jgi:hypothetical protein
MSAVSVTSDCRTQQKHVNANYSRSIIVGRGEQHMSAALLGPEWPVAVEKFVKLAVACRPQAHLFGILEV